MVPMMWKFPTKPWFRTERWNIWKGWTEETVIERLVQPPLALRPKLSLLFEVRRKRRFHPPHEGGIRIAVLATDLRGKTWDWRIQKQWYINERDRSHKGEIELWLRYAGILCNSVFFSTPCFAELPDTAKSLILAVSRIWYLPQQTCQKMRYPQFLVAQCRNAWFVCIWKAQFFVWWYWLIKFPHVFNHSCFDCFHDVWLKISSPK